LKGRNYRSSAGQAYTRMKYIHGSPAPKVSKFNMGDLSTHFARRVHLVSREAVQIRHNALESARVAANKVLFDKYGETGYRLQLNVYPHIILRENKMIATAGADRLQEGMRRAFGKPTGRAARVHDGQSILIVYVPVDGVETAKKALDTASTKFPMRTRVVVEEVQVDEQAQTSVKAPSPPQEEEPTEEAEEVAPVVATAGA
jgi:large subunit ribosomal protein L10e